MNLKMATSHRKISWVEQATTITITMNDHGIATQFVQCLDASNPQRNRNEKLKSASDSPQGGARSYYLE